MIRVLQDPPLDGPTNMARDEVLMTRVGTSDSPPTLRLYQWNPPTISLGYFQRYADYESLPPPAGTLPIVRRLTGGGAILHDQELTYSLALPTRHRLLANRPSRLYELAHEAITAALASLGLTAVRCGTTDDSGAARGPFFCFQRRQKYDVLIGEDKMVGSAQRRTRRAVLQHGSIVLGNRYEQQPTAQVSIPFDKAIAHIRRAFVEQFEQVTSERHKPGDWSDVELEAAAGQAQKYAGDEWTRRT